MAERTQWRGCDGVGLKGTPLESMTPGAETLSVMGRGCEPARESFVSRTGAGIFREQHVTRTASTFGVTIRCRHIWFLYRTHGLGKEKQCVWRHYIKQKLTCDVDRLHVQRISINNT
jgi:hypothetical protein